MEFLEVVLILFDDILVLLTTPSGKNDKYAFYDRGPTGVLLIIQPCVSIINFFEFFESQTCACSTLYLLEICASLKPQNTRHISS